MDYQDVLALLGAAHAHPGGRTLTRLWLEQIRLAPDAAVLEVGCGTGATLIRLKQRFRCGAVGVDIRPNMVDLARERARSAGADVQFICASAEALPFTNDSFDLVYTESVNVFLDAPTALREYYRVLKPGGVYVDVEMMVLWPVTDEWRREASRVYGIRWVPDQRGWKGWYTDAGFDEVQVLVSKPVRLEDIIGDNSQVDPNNRALHNPEVIRVLRDNALWMERNHPYLAYAAFLCRKRNRDTTRPE